MLPHEGRHRCNPGLRLAARLLRNLDSANGSTDKRSHVFTDIDTDNSTDSFANSSSNRWTKSNAHSDPDDISQFITHVETYHGSNG